ncbi:DUF4352 domain-containing protein [Streptomyces zagrosensis]|uniref:DUF4352 domain-containing protein n=1 Tax=Streptomyces zagrosensis TaxID=1042984 RepID=A0A7W9QFB4_9ACTN|nr:DUF4352 domain-containing protein [Streptomyces zagrosensis]MBB5939236.1 hypothetical protein [Streptomyces zagrosensis]
MKSDNVENDPPPTPRPVPTLAVGQSATFKVYNPDDDSDDDSNAATMQVTVGGLEYITEEQADPIKPGKTYLKAKLTIKNVGKVPGDFMAYGCMQWASATTPAQDVDVATPTGELNLDTRYEPGQQATGSIVLTIPERGGMIQHDVNPVLTGPAAWAVKLPA